MISAAFVECVLKRKVEWMYLNSSILDGVEGCGSNSWTGVKFVESASEMH